MKLYLGIIVLSPAAPVVAHTVEAEVALCSNIEMLSCTSEASTYRANSIQLHLLYVPWG